MTNTKVELLKLLKPELAKHGFVWKHDQFQREKAGILHLFMIGAAGINNRQPGYRFWLGMGIRHDLIEHAVSGIDARLEPRFRWVPTFGKVAENENGATIYWQMGAEELSVVTNDVLKVFNDAEEYYRDYSQLEKLLNVFLRGEEESIGFLPHLHRTGEIAAAVAYLLKQKDAFDALVERYSERWKWFEEIDDPTYARRKREIQHFKGVVSKLSRLFETDTFQS